MGKLLLGKLLLGKLVTGEVSIGEISGWGNCCWGSCDWGKCVGEVALGKWPNIVCCVLVTFEKNSYEKLNNFRTELIGTNKKTGTGNRFADYCRGNILMDK